MRLAALPRRTRLLVLLCTLGLGLLLFVWRLGSSGLVDETPPLFAASARGMVERGDWLIPHVNGLPRYDKPPLVYWLMGLLYALPGQSRWDPLGTWAASLPSALACIAVMLALADTLLRWPQPPPGEPAPVPPQAASAAPTVAPAAGFATAGLAVDPPNALPDDGIGARSGGLRDGLRAGPSSRCAALTALAAPLAFALSPLVLLWGRIPVSDGLFTSLVALSCLTFWRRLADPTQSWLLPWLLLGLAVLTKGPVAVVLVSLTLALFTLLQHNALQLLHRLRPGFGLLLTALVSAPWYALALWRDGQPFWDSFIGYHNLQRFTLVVNNHLQPWWYFLPVMLVAAIPVAPLLLLALVRAIGPLRLRRWRGLPLPASRCSLPSQLSLGRFAACWLLAILLFFTLAATKLPSYWLPATPAAALLVALIARQAWGCGDAGGLLPDRAFRICWWLTLALTALLALVLALGPLWVPRIFDPEMPSLPAELLASGALLRAACCWGLAAAAGWWLRARPAPLRLLGLQLPLVLFALTALLPSWALGDRLRGLPVRQMAAAATREITPGETLAMVGILKPSLHYYSRRVVIYEGIEPEGLVNLADRLRRESRPGLNPAPPSLEPTVLVVIDGRTAASPFWQGLAPLELSRFGLYRLWRMDRLRLERRASELRAQGHPITWDRPRPERY